MYLSHKEFIEIFSSNIQFEIIHSSPQKWSKDNEIDFEALREITDDNPEALAGFIFGFEAHKMQTNEDH